MEQVKSQPVQLQYKPYYKPQYVYEPKQDIRKKYYYLSNYESPYKIQRAGQISEYEYDIYPEIQRQEQFSYGQYPVYASQHELNTTPNIAKYPQNNIQDPGKQRQIQQTQRLFHSNQQYLQSKEFVELNLQKQYQYQMPQGQVHDTYYQRQFEKLIPQQDPIYPQYSNMRLPQQNIPQNYQYNGQGQSYVSTNRYGSLYDLQEGRPTTHYIPPFKSYYKYRSSKYDH